MGTNETYDKLLKLIYRDADCFGEDIPMTKRKLELVKVLQGLGLFCFYDHQYFAPAVSYRGHKFVFDMVEPHQLGFYADIASFDMDDYDVKCELYDTFNNINWSQFLAYIYEVEGNIVVSSSQYIGKRAICSEEVAYILQAMDELLRKFHKVVKKNEYLNDNVICI